MSEIQLTADISLGLIEITIGIITATIIWVVQRLGKKSIDSIASLSLRLRRRELKKIKRLRINPFDIQRQIAQEQAYFSTFLILIAFSFGLLR